MLIKSIALVTLMLFLLASFVMAIAAMRNAFRQRSADELSLAISPNLQDRIVVNQNKGAKLAGAAFWFFIAFIVAGAHIDGGKNWTIGAVSFVLFAALFSVQKLRSFFRNGPLITIDREGIRDLRLSSAVIPWVAFTTGHRWTFKQTDLISLSIAPEYRPPGSEFLWKRKSSKITFDLTETDHGPEHIFAMLRRYRPDIYNELIRLA